jgi:uncharacterized protein (DUF1697 family)
MTYVALLRGINVGGNNKVEMKTLKKLFEDLGFKDVVTYINSGNVVFSAGKLSPAQILKKINEAFQKHFKFEIKTIVKSQKEVVAICKKIPKTWVNDEVHRTDVMFLWKEVDTAKSLKELPQNPEVDDLVYTKGAIIWHMEKKNHKKSKVPKYIGSYIYKNMTARNANTTRKLLELMSK